MFSHEAVTWVDSFPPGFIEGKVQFCPQWVGDTGVRSEALSPGLTPSAAIERLYVKNLAWPPKLL